MTCADFLERHLEFLDGELSPDDERLAHGHLEGCSRCNRLHLALRRGLLLLNLMPSVRPSRGFRSSLSKRIRQDSFSTTEGSVSGAIFPGCRRVYRAHSTPSSSESLRIPSTCSTGTMSS